MINKTLTQNPIKQRLSVISKVFSAKFILSTKQIINKLCLKLGMKTIRTPGINYFQFGCVKFSTNRKDGELYYEIFKSNQTKSDPIRVAFGKVKDKAHLKELQEMEAIN